MIDGHLNLPTFIMLCRIGVADHEYSIVNLEEWCSASVSSILSSVSAVCPLLKHQLQLDCESLSTEARARLVAAVTVI